MLKHLIDPLTQMVVVRKERSKQESCRKREDEKKEDDDADEIKRPVSPFSRYVCLPVTVHLGSRFRLVAETLLS